MLVMPKNYTMISGIGQAQSKLTAFDSALVCAGIPSYSLVRISSIIPPECMMQKTIELPKGSPVLAAYSHFETDNSLSIAACIGIAIPRSNEEYGIIMEVSGFCTKEKAEQEVREMLQESMRFRSIEIGEIKIKSAVALKDNSNKFVSVFAAVLLW